MACDLECDDRSCNSTWSSRGKRDQTKLRVIAHERPRISAREFPCEEDDVLFSSSFTSVFNRLDLTFVGCFYTQDSLPLLGFGRRVEVNLVSPANLLTGHSNSAEFENDLPN